MRVDSIQRAYLSLILDAIQTEAASKLFEYNRRGSLQIAFWLKTLPVFLHITYNCVCRDKVYTHLHSKSNSAAHSSNKMFHCKTQYAVSYISESIFTSSLYYYGFPTTTVNVLNCSHSNNIHTHYACFSTDFGLLTILYSFCPSSNFFLLHRLLKFYSCFLTRQLLLALMSLVLAFPYFGILF